MSEQPKALRVAHELECRALINEISLDDDFVMELDAARLLRKQHAEIERLRADAERYRWLRENALAMDTVADPDNFVQIWVGTDPASCFKARTLDAAIDAAMKEGKP